MIRTILQRFAGTVAVLIVASVISFLLVQLAPGDASNTVARHRAGIGASPEYVAQVRRELGLDEPLAAQYLQWLAGVSRGDLGVSIRTGRPIAAEIATRLPVTLLLAAGAALFSLLVAIPIGVIGALRPGSRIDRILRTVALTSVSVPEFWLGFMLILVFSLTLRLTPTFGMSGIQAMILPWVTLGLRYAGSLSQVIRTTLRSTLSNLYVTTAYAKGLRTPAVIARHALGNVFVPVIAVFGTMLGQMISGAIVVEIVFSWPGLASYYVDSVAFRDLPAIQAAVLVFAAVFVLLNLVVDVCQVVVDPRMRGRAAT